MSQVNRSLGTDFVQTECQLHYEPKHLKGMVGQTAARRAAGVVVEMVKEGMKELNSQYLQIHAS